MQVRQVRLVADRQSLGRVRTVAAQQQHIHSAVARITRTQREQTQALSSLAGTLVGAAFFCLRVDPMEMHY
eukprot:SAG25_NODE_1632_length_2646_cov_70.906949_3_plen_71_part_00